VHKDNCTLHDSSLYIIKSLKNKNLLKCESLKFYLLVNYDI
jgi:hypothetical protein